MPEADVRIATREDWEDLLALWAQDRAEETNASAEEVRSGAASALRAYDFLASDAFWVVLAHVGGEPAGLAHACRIPKVDERTGFLYVDEVYVAPAHRRKGVGVALLRRVKQLSEELGLAGVRLLVRPENDAARALYRRAGFQEYPTMLCQWKSFRGE